MRVVPLWTFPLDVDVVISSHTRGRLWGYNRIVGPYIDIMPGQVWTRTRGVMRVPPFLSEAPVSIGLQKQRGQHFDLILNVDAAGCIRSVEIERSVYSP